MTETILKRRRWTGVVAAVTVAALALTACANGDENDGNSAGGDNGNSGTETSESLLPEAEGTTEYPLTLSTRAGETVLEDRPERIAIFGVSPNWDYLDALDAVPVYSITEDTDWAWRDQSWVDQIETVDTVTRRDDVNVEGIAMADPDLIIGFNSINDETLYSRLTDIAPVLDFDGDAGGQGDQGDWRQAQLLVGEALDLSEAAQAAVDAVDEQIAGLADKYPEYQGKTITFAAEYDNGLQFYNSTGSTAEQLFGDLGFEPSPVADQFVDDNLVSAENYGLLDTDVLVVVYMTEESRDNIENSDIFRSLDVVANGGYLALVPEEDDVYTMVNQFGEGLENPTWIFRRGASTLSVPWALDVLGDQWIGSLDLQ